MKLTREFIGHYPWQTGMLVVALLVAGVADGIGISAMLPVLDLAFDSGVSGTAADAGEGALSQWIRVALAFVHLEPTIGLLLTVIVLGIGLKNLLVFLTERSVGYIAADFSTDLRLRLLRAISRSQWHYYVRQSIGELANSMATEPWRASMAYVLSLKLFAVMVEMLVYTAIAFAASWRATLICLAASLLIVGASHGLVRLAQRGGVGQTRWYRALLGTLTDLLQSVKSFKAMGKDAIAAGVFARQTHKLGRHLKLEALGNAALDAAQEPLLALVIAVGVYLAIVEFSMAMSTVTFLALVLAKLMNQAGKIQKQYQRLMTCDSAYWALLDVIREAESQAEVPSGARAPTLVRGVELRDVCFDYADHRVLDCVSLSVPAGELTCLTGGSGAGKSTIVDLVIGLIRPTDGRVLVDGVPLDEIDMRTWRGMLGYVPQENLLLHDSVLHNITLGVEQFTEEDVVRALQLAGAWSFVAQMPEGVHSTVGERGVILSGGQRQRIMLARALVHRPRLLVLDEATSALDPATEAALCATLATLKPELTILAVSHRPMLASIADRIYRLEGGHISAVEPGQPFQARV